MAEKNDVLLHCVDVFKAIAHPVRLQIVEMLAEGEQCSCRIAEAFPGCDRTTVSKHLALMVEKGVLKAEKRGVNVFYSLRLTCLSSAVRCVRRSLSTGNCRGSSGCGCASENHEEV
jgi:DNA-binding transcriptional ArsR family regulator